MGKEFTLILFQRDHYVPGIFSQVNKPLPFWNYQKSGSYGKIMNEISGEFKMAMEKYMRPVMIKITVWKEMQEGN